MTNNSNSKNRSYIPILLILFFLLIAGFTAIYFLYLKKPHLVYIELPHPLPLSQGDSRQLTAIGIYSDKSKKDIAALVTWRSSDSEVAGVDNSGFVKSVSAGKTIITATNFETGLFFRMPAISHPAILFSSGPQEYMPTDKQKTSQKP
ncbi:MAG: Ig-like domain-containing protein [Deltaproteobacteria bacterium]|nr:Ig-like domain-containing protein [Deltaproteobacteria bacterium]